ncbi:hypothetical protein SDC9_207480 [bioreactor metagenome]|uniref:Na(+)/H(+) antiporter subunit F n=1 Tax=bioreactor metagenome TaxID=1076179 RepID=A0A645J7X0_9ZZZZ
MDRALAADLLTSVAIALTVLVIVWWNRADLQVLLVVFALTGLFSSTTIAKFIGKESKVRGEPLPSAQVEQFEAKLAEEEAWLERRLHLGRHGTVETTGPERSGDYAETTEEEQ